MGKFRPRPNPKHGAKRFRFYGSRPSTSARVFSQYGIRTFTGHFLHPTRRGGTLQYLFAPSSDPSQPQVRLGTKVNVWFNHTVLDGALAEMAKNVVPVAREAGLQTAREGITIAQQIVREMGLVATGVLIDSFVAKYTEKGAELENIAPHAYFVQYGTGWGTNSPNIAFGVPYFPHVGSILEWLLFKVNPLATWWDARRVALKIERDGTPATRFMDRIRDALAPLFRINVVIHYERWMKSQGLWPGQVASSMRGRPVGRFMRRMSGAVGLPTFFSRTFNQGNSGLPGGQGGSPRGNRPRTIIRGPRQRRGPYDGGSGSGPQGGQ